MKKRISVQPSHDKHLFYVIRGNQSSRRVPLVLIHGLCEDHSVWDAVVSALEPHGIVCCLDLPGFGQSDPPSSPKMEEYALALEALAQEEGFERMAVAGHSLGGYVTLQSMVELQDKLQGAILVHSHPFVDSPERAASRLRSIEILEQGHKELFVRQLFPNLFAPRYAEEHPEVLEQCIQMGLRQSEVGIITALKTMLNRRSHLDTLEKFEQPVMAILGDEDKLVPLEDTRRAVERAPRAEVHVLKGVGHMSMFEASEALSAHILNFWLQLDSY
ncbi:MAG: alpha/beta hydrolase [Saprospiraceae bacterium]|nr:alpha/beta hydrolase [Saprospiraceae bacterium]MDW8483781.1 alpha/beta hydrolase [Saprospiraceae bacterium]